RTRMHIKFNTLVGGLVGGATIMLTAAVSTPAALAATSSHAAIMSVQTPNRPAYTAKVTLTVRCGKFVGEIDHGGIGGILDPAYLAVKGKLTSSCNSTTELEIKWNVGFTNHSKIIAHVGPRKSIEVDWEIKSRNGQYADIGGRVGTTDGQPKGKIHWGG